MSLRSKIIGTASALALVTCVAGPASALEDTFSADYSHFSVNNGGGHGDSYGANGAAMVDLNSNFALDGAAGYHHVTVSSSGVDNWNIDGAAMWTGDIGRAGAVVGYNASSGVTDLRVTNYGAFGDWYATNSITLGLKGGGFSANHGANGDYFGGAVTGYLTPDLSLQGGYDYTHLNNAGNENDWSVRAEYLLSEDTNAPFAIYAGYTNSKIGSGGPTINVFSVGITLYGSSAGSESLEAHQRGGVEQWGASFGPTLLKF